MLETDSRGVVLAKGFNEVPEKVKGILGGTLVTAQTGEKGKKVKLWANWKRRCSLDSEQIVRFGEPSSEHVV